MNKQNRQILERLIQRDAMEEQKDTSTEYGLEAIAEAFNVEITEEYINSIKEKYPGFFEEPEDVLDEFDIGSVKRKCDQYHKNGQAVLDHYLSMDFEQLNSLSTVKKGVPSIFVNKNTDRYTFLILEDFEAGEEDLIGGDRSSLIVTEPMEGFGLEKILKEFSGERGKIYNLSKTGADKDSQKGKSLYRGVCAFNSINLANIVLLGTLNPFLSISAGLVSYAGFNAVPYLADNYKVKKTSKKMKEIKEDIDSRYVKGDNSIIYLGRNKPYDPELILRGLTIAKVKDINYIQQHEREEAMRKMEDDSERFNAYRFGSA